MTRVATAETGSSGEQATGSETFDPPRDCWI